MNKSGYGIDNYGIDNYGYLPSTESIQNRIARLASEQAEMQRVLDGNLAREAKLEAEKQERLDHYGEDVYENGAVLTWDEDGRYGKKLTYVALKAGNRWWVTGHGPNEVSYIWSNLISFISGQPSKMEDVYMVTQYELVSKA